MHVNNNNLFIAFMGLFRDKISYKQVKVKSRLSLIVRVNVVLNRTVVVDSD